MYKPGGIDRTCFFVKAVKNNSAGKKPEKGKGKNRKAEPAEHHRGMIERKSSGAENICEFSSGKIFCVMENKTPEEKLFKKGIRKGNIERNEKKIFFSDAGVFRKGTGNF